MKIMKKIAVLLIIATILTLSPFTTNAAIGEVIGTAYHTDIVAYINNYAIPSYIVNGTSAIVVEDLTNFGFDIIWDEKERSLTIGRYGVTIPMPNPMNFSKTGNPNSKFANIYSTDIVVYLSYETPKNRINSYNLNGYTMVALEDLTRFGNCYWDPNARTVELNVEDMKKRSSKQQITAYNPIVSSDSAVAPQSNFDKLKNYITEKGNFSDGRYIVIVNDSTLFAYETGEDEINLHLGKSSKKSTVDTLISLKRANSPTCIMSYKNNNGNQYSMFGVFSSSNGKFSRYTNDFPTALKESANNLLNSGLKLLDIDLQSTIGLSLSGFGIYYD